MSPPSRPSEATPDLAKTDLDAGLRSGAAERAFAALRLTETWRPGDARPELPDFGPVAEELMTALREHRLRLLLQAELDSDT